MKNGNIVFSTIKMIEMKKFNLTRVIAYVIYLFFLLNTIALVIVGAYRSINAYIDLTHFKKFGTPGHHPALEIVESMDIFIIGLVFLVFTIGIRTLFIHHNNESYTNSIPSWMRVKNLTELKLLLMESIIASLFIIFISVIAQTPDDNVGWQILMIPASILILSISIYFLKKRSDH